MADAQRIILSDTYKRYHVGCGRMILPNFLNIDGIFDWVDPSLQAGSAYNVNQIEGAAILKHDLSKGIPAETGSLNVVYHCHFLEHLSNEAGKRFLVECHRALAPGGLMRIAVPDFGLWCRNLIEKKDDFFKWYKEAFLGANNDLYNTNAEIFTGMIYNWGHAMAYDEETLRYILERIGFVDVKTYAWSVSEALSDIQLLETDDNPRKFESLIVECTKRT